MEEYLELSLMRDLLFNQGEEFEEIHLAHSLKNYSFRLRGRAYDKESNELRFLAEMTALDILRKKGIEREIVSSLYNLIHIAERLLFGHGINFYARHIVKNYRDLEKLPKYKFINYQKVEEIYKRTIKL